MKYKDVDANGSRLAETEPGLEGWTIVVYSDEDSSGDLSSGDTLAGTAVTDPTGAYSFTLNPGDYIVCEMAQDNWAQTEPGAGGACASDSGLADNGYLIPLVGGVDQPGKDFGNTPLSDIEVDFFDLTGFTNASISCVDESEATVGGPQTDDEGASPESKYLAEDLRIGTYTCTIVISDP